MEGFHENLVSLDEAVTLDGMFASRIRRSPDREAYRYFDRNDQAWHSHSWADMGRHVARWREALAAEGLPSGSRVAVQLRNCPEWVMFDQAALSLGLVTVPLYTDDRPDNIAYILKEADVRVLLVQDAGRWRRLAAALDDAGQLSRVLLLDERSAASEVAENDPRVRLVAHWLPGEGGELPLRADRDPHALASIVYTSGTTGRPKGVMLSHHNMMSVAYGGVTLLDVYQEDVFLSFLPLSHTLERTVGYYLCVMTGSCVAYARSISQLGEDLQRVRPTVLIAVPRVFERVYAKVAGQIAKKGAMAQRLFELTLRIGWQRFLHQQGRGGWSPGFLLWPVLERLVASKVTEKLGGRVRAAVSGGAALNDKIGQAFIALGVPIVQGYGLTETAPVVSANPLEDNIPESVGVPILNVEVRIGENEELLVKGPGVMLGYWNNHAATAEVIDADGWLHTGDQARIDERNHIYITGRIKDILVLSNGEKVPPGDMESAIAFDPLIEQVLVVGEGRPFMSALLVLDGDQWQAFAREIGVDPSDSASLSSDQVRQAVTRRIAAALTDFPGYAKIRRVHLSLEPWTVEDGLMTPTMKIKRALVLERNAAVVEDLYR